jgi:hypothetical protein
MNVWKCLSAFFACEKSILTGELGQPKRPLLSLWATIWQAG